MASKYINIELSELPYIQTDEDGNPYYAVRYRIVSDDRNRFSHWSPTIRVDYPETVPYNNEDNPERVHLSIIGQTPKTIIGTWSSPIPQETIYDDVETFDIFMQWKDNDKIAIGTWFYVTTVTANTFSALVPEDSSIKHVDVAIQIPTLKRERNTKITLFLVENHNI